MHNELAALINKNVPTAKATVFNPEDKKMDSSITIDATALSAVAAWLKSNTEMPFNALQVITGVDWMTHIEVNYVFGHFEPGKFREIILKVNVKDRVNGELDSICSLYPAANYQERECYDMLGIKFKNHPDHRRILCPDDWEGFPLRRDYMTQKVYRGMEVYPDSKMNMADREFIVRQEMIKKAQGAASDKVE